MEQESESTIENMRMHPRCEIVGCTEEPTLAQQRRMGFVFFCDRHREDLRLAYQRDANWRHKLKVKYGIVMEVAK